MSHPGHTRRVFKGGKWITVPWSDPGQGMPGLQITGRSGRPVNLDRPRVKPDISKTIGQERPSGELPMDVSAASLAEKWRGGETEKFAGTGVSAAAAEDVMVPGLEEPMVSSALTTDQPSKPITSDQPSITGEGAQPTQDWMTSVGDLLGYDPERGGRTVTGDLAGQLGAWADLEGTFRQDYDWRNQGTPQSPKEAFMFLQQAQGSAANQITFTQFGAGDPIMQRADRILWQHNETETVVPTEMLRWAKEIRRVSDFMGGQLYTRGGEVVTDEDEIMEYKNMVQYKARAQQLIDGYREGRQNLFDASIKQGYAMDLEGARTASSAQVARIQQESAEAVANIQAFADAEVEASRARTAKMQSTTLKDISAAEVTGRKEVADIQVAGALTVEEERQRGGLTIAEEQQRGGLAIAEERERGGLAIAKEQSRGAEDVEIQRGIQDTNRIREQAKQDIANIEAKRDADMGLLTEELTVRERMSQREQDTALLKITRESDAQKTLVQLSADLDMELETSKQDWQTAENNKQIAIQEGNLQESIRANFMQEQIQIEQQQIERETNSLNMLMNVSQNPALLYFMNESGMLSGVGANLLGQDTVSLIADLTASIDPGDVPNIQTYNPMSALQQQIANFRAGATKGMTPESMQEYLQGSSPFTRGQRSTIRVGSRVNPFETMNA